MYWLLAIVLLMGVVEQPNGGFEQGLQGWRVGGHPSFSANVLSDVPAIEGSKYLNVGWRARNATPRNATISITTSVDARPYRGRRLRFSAMTKVPDFAAGASTLAVRVVGAGGALSEVRARVGASEDWRSHSVDFTVPERAETIEFGFVVKGPSGELDADATRLELVD